MKKFLLLFLLISILTSNGNAQSTKKGKYPTGIVYGPKGAYKIDAPKNWILDNESGLSMGLHCVLYVKGYNWNSSPVIMYAKIASTSFENIDTFIDFAIDEFVRQDPDFHHQEFKTGIVEKNRFIVMDYQGGPYNSYERVLYIQMEKAVGYVVFSARNEADFEEYAAAILEIVDSYQYKPKYIDYKVK